MLCEKVVSHVNLAVVCQRNLVMIQDCLKSQHTASFCPFTECQAEHSWPRGDSDLLRQESA